MKALDAERFTYFVFGKVEYTDVGTGTKHWTHVCYRYMPKEPKTFLSGFRQCTTYNDIDKN